MKSKLAFAVSAVCLAVSAGALAAGDAERGKPLYAVCGSCHGVNAEGNEAMNAPALDGLESWYLVRQLRNFREGIRGANPKDTFGMQMAPMAAALPNEQAIEDVVAYIATLGK